MSIGRFIAGSKIPPFPSITSRLTWTAGHRRRDRCDRCLVRSSAGNPELVVRRGRSEKCDRARARCVDAVRLQLCRRCGAQFAVCRSCDRGQEHCTRTCAAETRRLQLAEIRRRYRRSPAGRAAHREQERRRRGRQRQAPALSLAIADADTVGDQPSQIVITAGSLAAESRAGACLDATPNVAEVPKPEPAPFHCHRCTKTTHFVAHAGWEPRWLTRNRGSTRRRLDRQITTENVRR